MSSLSSPNVRPEWAEPLVSAPQDGDDTGWLITFSDLVLQLFAFVMVTAVVGGATRQTALPEVATSAVVELASAAAPSDASTTNPPSRAREARAQVDAPELPPARDPAIAAFEPATAWAGDAPAQTRPAPETAPRPALAPVIEEIRPSIVPKTLFMVVRDVPPARAATQPAGVSDDGRSEEARPATAEPAAVADAPHEAPPPVVTPTAAEKRLLALGRYLSAFVAATASDEATVTAGDGDVRLAFGGRLGFRPGSAELLPAGRSLLREVQRLASGVPDVGIEVAGYTDDVPIHTREFPSNLELSLSRAARVVREIQRDDPALAVRTVALGFGEHHAIAPNDGPENRARNRRVEVRLVPRG